MGNLQLIDYGIVAGSLTVSAAVGFYYGVIKKRDNSVEEYFLASRNLSWFKMGCSLFATLVSSGFIIGLIAETYEYGVLSFIGFPAYILALYINFKIFFPVFHQIGSYDLYKFYELKFCVSIRYFLSITTIFDKILINSIMLYGMSSAFSQISDISVWTLICTLTFICVTYSALGGVRGVTLADMVQAMVIMFSIVITCVLGTAHIGGVGEAWRRSWDGGRLDIFDFRLDPTVRHTLWTAIIASPITTIAGVTTSQTSTLRVMASDDVKTCGRAMMFSACFSVTVLMMCLVLGLLTYALFYNCDPMSLGAISSTNQLVSVFVTESLQSYSGLIGLFFAGLICAAISTVSSNLNGITALTMETLVRPFNKSIRDDVYTKWAKIFAVILGLCSLLGIIIVQRFPNVYQAMLTLSAVSNGPHFALLFIGCFFPQASLKSSVGGFAIGLVFMLWVLMGGLISKFPSASKKPVSIDGCSVSNFTFLAANQTLFPTAAPVDVVTTTENIWAPYFPLSSVSFNWMSGMGIVMTLIPFGLLALIYGNEKKKDVDINLIPTPIQQLHKKLNKTWRKKLLCDVYTHDEELLETKLAQYNGNGALILCQDKA